MKKLKQLILDSILFSYVFIAVTSFFIPSSENELEVVSFYALLTGGILPVTVILSFILNEKLKLPTLGYILFNKKPVHQSGWKNIWKWQLAIVLGITLFFGFVQTQFSMYNLTDPDGFQGALRLFSHLLQPNFSILPTAILKIIETIFIAFMATVFAIPIAFSVCFLCAKNIMSTHPLLLVLYFILRFFINVIRSVESLIWAIIFSVWIGIGPFAGMLALMLHTIASLIKQYSEIVETVREEPIEGIRSTGANHIQTIWFAIVPQVFLPFIAFTIYRWDINVRMATIIGLVGGGGIGKILMLYQGQALWHEVGCIVVVIAAVVWMMDTTSAYVREALK